jgi:hypothetical protein
MPSAGSTLTKSRLPTLVLLFPVCLVFFFMALVAGQAFLPVITWST